MKGLHRVAFTLLIIGGLNWLLVGLLGWDIGELFGGMDAIVSRIIYIVVGVSAVVEVVAHKNRCKECNTGSTPAATVPGQGMGVS